MMQVSPANLIAMIKQGQNPQQLMMSVLENQMQGTPLGDNLLTLAKNNQTGDIEKIVRNLFQQKGLNYDQALSNLKKVLGL